MKTVYFLAFCAFHFFCCAFPSRTLSSTLEEKYENNNSQVYNCSGVELTKQYSIIRCKDFSGTEESSQSLIVEIHIPCDGGCEWWDNTYFECTILEFMNDSIKVDCGNKNKRLFRKQTKIEFLSALKKPIKRTKILEGRKFRVKFNKKP